MSVIALILGESGTGKTTSLRNFDENEIAYVNVSKKPLPFRKRFESIDSDNSIEICKFLKTTDKKVIIIDDCQYIMAFQYLRRLGENGWDKYNEIQSDFFNIIDVARDLPDDKIVFFLSHIQNTEDGRQKIKTIGKMLDEKITVEGMFTIVLKTYVADGKYYFTTQNSGRDTVKSPMNMFPAITVENDLKYIAEKIKNYYYMDGAKSDDEMSVDDSAVATPINPNEKKSRRRKSKEDVEITAQNDPKDVEITAPDEPLAYTDEKPKRRRKQRVYDEVEVEVDVPF